MEKVKNLKLVNVSGGGQCELLNYGGMRDVISQISYEFMPGNVYAVIGECGNGGWALSTLLVGKNKIDLGDIFVNSNKINSDELEKYSCYVGEDAGLKKYFGLKSMSVKEQIEYGIKNNKSFSKDVNEIKLRFGLSDERFEREIKYLSGERWKASMAIGYSLGKSIYCFPWMNTKNLLHLEEHIKLCLSTLMEIGAIVVIPTSKVESIEEVYKNYKMIELQ